MNASISRNILLVDGTAMAYRAFFGIRDLSTRDNIPTNALFGFIRAIQHLKNHWNADVVVAFDGGSPQARLEKCPEYKAQRSPMPDGLRQQLPLLNEYLVHAGIPWILLPHQEADDVLATLVTIFSRRGDRIILATGDKDLMQLISANVCMVPPVKSADVLDEAAVLQKTGVRPDQIVDWLALIGDNADNISGVPGVGPKTATKLISAYGSIEKIWAALDTVEPISLREKLSGHRDIVARNQALITLNTVLSGVPEVDALISSPGDPVALAEFLQRYELHSLFSTPSVAPSISRKNIPPPPSNSGQMQLF